MFIFYFLIRFFIQFFSSLSHHQMDMKTIGSIYYENYVSTLITNVSDIKIMIKYFITLFGLLYPQLFQLFSIQPQQNNKNFFYFHRFHHFHDFQHEKSQTYPGMVPYKRAAGDKSSIPLYQHNTTGNYQQIMHMQQPFVPVSCEYSTNV